MRTWYARAQRRATEGALASSATIYGRGKSV